MMTATSSSARSSAGAGAEEIERGAVFVVAAVGRGMQQSHRHSERHPRSSPRDPGAASAAVDGRLPSTMQQHTQQHQHQHQHPHSHPQQYETPPPLPTSLPLQRAPYPAVAAAANGVLMQQQPPHLPPYPSPTSSYRPAPGYANGGMAMPLPPPPLPQSQPPNMMGGYRALPPHIPLDAQQHVPAVRGKKEIKRRTKTGCLTCRKRRIKCDEGQPHCRNCAKSKRECLGYDPIFKQQSAPAPIQPAPTIEPTTPIVSLSNAQAAQHTPTFPAPLPPPPPPPPQIHSAPTNSVPFAPTPAVGDATYPYDPAAAAPPPSLDPALGGQHARVMAQGNNYSTQLQSQRTVKAIPIDELFAVGGPPPPFEDRAAPLSPSSLQEVVDVYKFHYASGLDSLFETTWYSHQGPQRLRSDTVLSNYVYQCAEHFKTVTGSSSPPYMRSIEASLVWQLASMPRTANPPVPDLTVRIDTLEHLLTGTFLDPTKVPNPPNPNDQDKSSPSVQSEAFWCNLARFTSARDDTADPTAARQIDETLAAMRLVLGLLESRDVLYSIAIVRHIGGRIPEFHPQRHLVASSNDPNDDVNKLKVAHQFVEGEDQKGTNQVVQRICSMALRGWALQKQ